MKNSGIITILMLTIIAVVLTAFTVAQAYMAMDLAKTEQQAYRVIWSDGELEARFYPKAVMATVRCPAASYRSSSTQNFRVLAGYIFGGNEEKQSISMTSPVHMSFDDSGSQMSFIMPLNMDLNALPTPNNRGIKFRESEEKYVVAVQFGGWADDAKISKNAQKLVDLLNAKGVEIDSEPWYMGYNPPFQIMNRRNEVAVQITSEQIASLKR